MNSVPWSANSTKQIISDLPKTMRVNDTPRGNRYHYELDPAVRVAVERLAELDALVQDIPVSIGRLVALWNAVHGETDAQWTDISASAADLRRHLRATS